MERSNSFIGVGMAFLLLIMIFGGVAYLGIFNLSPAASYSMGASESVSGMQDSYNYKSSNYRTTYHVFNYFNSGALSVMLFLGIIITLVMVDRLYKETGSLLAFAFYILGTLLIFSSSTIFIFGVHDLLTFTGHGETTIKPTMMQQYGWLIESVIFGILGSALVWAGEYIRRREEEQGSLAHLAIAPVASMLVLFTIPIFIFGVHASVGPGYSKPSFEWIIETIIFGGLAVVAFIQIDKIRLRNGETQSWKSYPLFASGYSLLLPASFMFIFGILMLLNSEVDSEDMGKLFLEIFIFSIFGFISFHLIDLLKKREGDRDSAFPLALDPGGFLFMLSATMAFIFGFSTWVRADVTASTYKSSFAWVVETILFGLIGIACLSISDRIRNRIGDMKNQIPRAFSTCGTVIWIASMWFYILAINSYIGDAVPDGKLLVEFMLYGATGLGLIIYSDRLRKQKGFLKDMVLSKVLSFSGGILLLITLLMFIAGLHEFLYSTEANMDWLMKDVAYGIAGAAYILIGNHMKPILPSKKTKKPREKKKERVDEKGKETRRQILL
ncbi:MAG: hypothetical protein ABIG39_02585 [Candidatus Micrarchaeota archaeon]